MGEQVILVVEDEVLIRMVITEILQEAGYHTVEAANGDEGMAILLTGRRLDLLITDVRMPGETDGLALATRWKQLHPSRPVIMASGHLSHEPGHPADTFISKPYTDGMLLAAVVNLIGNPCQSQAQDRNAS